MALRCQSPRVSVSPEQLCYHGPAASLVQYPGVAQHLKIAKIHPLATPTQQPHNGMVCILLNLFLSSREVSMLVAAPEKKVHMAQGLTDIVFRSETSKPPPPPGVVLHTCMRRQLSLLQVGAVSFLQSFNATSAATLPTTRSLIGLGAAVATTLNFEQVLVMLAQQRCFLS